MKLYVAKKNGKWCSNSRGGRPTFYKTIPALYSSVFGYNYPKQIKEAVLNENLSNECFQPENKQNWNFRRIRFNLYDKYIKDNKISTKQLLQMFQDEGIIEVFEIDEEEMLNTYLQSKNLI